MLNFYIFENKQYCFARYYDTQFLDYEYKYKNILK